MPELSVNVPNDMRYDTIMMYVPMVIHAGEHSHACRLWGSFLKRAPKWGVLTVTSRLFCKYEGRFLVAVMTHFMQRWWPSGYSVLTHSPERLHWGASPGSKQGKGCVRKWPGGLHAPTQHVRPVLPQQQKWWKERAASQGAHGGKPFQ